MKTKSMLWNKSVNLNAVCNCIKFKYVTNNIGIGFALLIVLSFASYGQEDNITKQLSAKRDVLDCETISLNAADILSESLSANNNDTFNLIINAWIKACGISECTQRLIIIKSIINNENPIDSIKSYFENNLHYVLKNRIYDSKKPNYGYIYSDYKSYFCFVPLRHKIDSIVISKSKELLKSKNLSADEKLICLLFSFDIEQFDNEILKHNYKECYIRNYMRDEKFKYHNRWIAYTLYSGIYTPIGTERIFNYSPIIGITFSTPLQNKIIVELGFKFRRNINDKDFKFFALGDTNNINSEIGYFFGGLVGYKIYENNNLIIIPKFGIGIESIGTGLSKKGKTNEENEYFDVKTLHISFGLSAIKPIFNRNYIGFGINYHYSPYHLVKELHTKFNNNALSGEIFFRF